MTDSFERSSLPRRAVLHAAWAVPVIGLAVASPASAASFDGPPPSTYSADISVVPGGPFGQMFMLRGIDSNNGPMSGITVEFQGRSGPATWVGITSNQTSGGYYMVAVPLSLLAPYERLRTKAIINGVDYYSGDIAVPS